MRQEIVGLASPASVGIRATLHNPNSRPPPHPSHWGGRYEIYVQPFPGLGAKLQISTEGGTEPI